jgi:diaminopimelate decarboxylase
MPSRISATRISAVLHLALQEKDLIHEDDTAIIFYDLSYFKERIKDLVALFPASTLHAIAIKANPLAKILIYLNELGLGLEAASLPELYLAEQSGFPADRIVFDSPVKTAAELAHALELGIHINADSFHELERIAALKKTLPSASSIGVRINPQVGSGTILSTSVAGEYSKFGIALKENRAELLDCFLRHDWLRGVHLHIGSQGCAMPLLTKGVEAVFDFVNEANACLRKKQMRRRIDLFDIGGGLPVSYHREQQPVSLAQYAQELRSRCAALFNEEFKIITEFGRYIHANAGWVASRVEYVKKESQINTVMIHVGADLFLRKCYRPEDWHHEMTVHDHQGKIKTGRGKNKYVIAGPLCFAGDLLAQEIELPRVEQDDFIVIHDAGAYTLSMWSRYNSRQIPKVIGYYEDGKKFEILKEKENLEQIRKFWS